MTSRIIKFVFIFLIYFFVASCGGGGSSTQGGIGGTGVSSGRVEGFGSVIVNGVHFDTTNAVVTKDDDSPVTNLNDADINLLLSKGMIINIEGSINADGVTGIAEKIIYQDNLEGPVIGTPAVGASSFNALGQTVIVSSLTQFSGGLNSIADISDGQVIEISGFNDVNGDIVATFIDKKADSYSIGSTVFEIKGTVTVVNGTSFTIGGLTIVTTNTAGLNNLYVEANGVFNGTDTLSANTVEIKTEGFTVNNADDVELEGIALTGCSATPCDFTLNATTVRLTNSTVYKAGTVADINPGVILEAEGSLQNGILVAEEIEFNDNIEIQSDVQSKGSNTVVLDFGATDLTVVVDTNITDIRNCSTNTFADITGNVVVRARKTISNIIATRIECGGTAGEVMLQVEIDSYIYDEMTMLGLTVNTSALTDAKFKDTNGIGIGRVNFYNALSDGRLTQAIGIFSGGIVTWLEVKLEL